MDNAWLDLRKETPRALASSVQVSGQPGCSDGVLRADGGFSVGYDICRGPVDGIKSGDEQS